MKVVHITSVHQPFDTRIFYKECVSLARAGYETVLIVPADCSEMVDGVQIRAIPRPSNRKQRVLKTMWQVYGAAMDEDADLYHFHDPELILVGILLKLRGKKVVYDVHENLPAQILGKSYLRYRWLRGLLAGLAGGVEKLAYALFDGVVVANPLVASRFPKRKSVTVANYPILSLIDSVPPADEEHPQEPVLIYVGGLRDVRGICELMQAFELLPQPAQLWLAGPWVSESFRKKCEEMAVWERVRYLGFLSPVEVYSYLKLADVGLVTLLPQENYLTNLPVKAFEYMACSLPMIMSDFPYWREVFAGTACFVDSRSPEAIAEAISSLLEQPQKAAELGWTGRKLVEDKFSWEQEEKKLLALYEDILAGGKDEG